MRLLNSDIKIIKTTILKHIEDAKIILFGSRIDNNKRGGDIDLLIQTQKDIKLKDEIEILAKIEYRGVERKIDLLIDSPYKKRQSIFDTAIKEGVVL